MDLKFNLILTICLLFCITKRLSNNQKKIINLAFPINNRYINYLYTALVSLFENSNNNTIYKVHIQISDTFEINNKNLLYDLEKIYFNCFIIFINMYNDFSTAIKGALDSSTYYRLKLPILLPNINRIIHIDGDSIILKDLMELYTLNFDGKYILGRLDMIVDELDSLGIYTKTYINCGILLLDLYSLRKYNYVDKFMEYIQKHNNYRYLNHHDQTLINYIVRDNIGFLRPKYHMWPFGSISVVKEFNNKLRTKYNITELILDYYDPFIVHFAGSGKKNMSIDTIYHKKYIYYLKKSNEIRNKTHSLSYLSSPYNFSSFSSLIES